MQRVNLDILRSFAVISVVFAHLPWSHTASYYPQARIMGLLGVLFFFVHTSLVLLMSLERSPGIAGFYWRRFFRIYPLAIVAMAICLFTGLTDTPVNELRSFSSWDLISNFLMVENFLSHKWILGILWTLPWEVQMYAVLPFIYLAGRRFWLAGAMLWLAVVIGVPILHLGKNASMATIPAFFAAGCLCYELGKRVKPVLPAYLWPWTIPAIMALRVAIKRDYDFASPADCAINAGTCLLLALAIPFYGDITSRWVRKPAELIAKYSYGIYVSHYSARLFVWNLDLPYTAKLLLWLVITASVSVALYHLVEFPCIRFAKRALDLKARRKAVADGIADGIAGTPSLC